MLVRNFKILSHVVPEKTLTDKQTDKLPSLLKRQKLYTPYFVYRDKLWTTLNDYYESSRTISVRFGQFPPISLGNVAIFGG